MRSDKKKEDDSESSEAKKRRYTEEGKAKARERFTRDEPPRGGHPQETPSGFGKRPRGADDYSDEEVDADNQRRNSNSRRSGSGCKRLVPGKDRPPQRRPRF